METDIIKGLGILLTGMGIPKAWDYFTNKNQNTKEVKLAQIASHKNDSEENAECKKMVSWLYHQRKQDIMGFNMLTHIIQEKLVQDESTSKAIEEFRVAMNQEPPFSVEKFI